MTGKLEAIKPVYSLYSPEVREIIDSVVAEYPHDIFLQSIDPGLDDFHEPIIEKILEFYRGSVPNLMDFAWRYPTSGAEEGIHEVLTKLQTEGVKFIYTLKGEYEGYKAVAETRDIKTIEVSQYNAFYQRPGYWFISNPSARDGCIISDAFILALCDLGHVIFYDLSYLGSVGSHSFDLSHPNIFAAVLSFSKAYGLYYYRAGITLSREQIPSLYGTKWFKNILTLLIMERIVDTLKPFDLYSHYKGMQAEIVEEIREDLGLPLIASDSFLLAYMPSDTELSEEDREMVAPFLRGRTYRFCLTPYFLKKLDSTP